MSPSWLSGVAPDVAIEISAERVAVASMSVRPGGAAIGAYASEVLPAGAVTPSLIATNLHDRPGVEAAVRRALERTGSRPKRVALVIPDSAAKVSILRFDRIPERQTDLDQLVRWQLRKTTPFPVEDAVVTYTLGRRLDEQAREVVVTLARRAVVEEYERMCLEVGAHAGLVDLSTISLLNLVLAGTPPSDDWLLVHLRADAITIAIMRGTDLIFYRHRGEGEAQSLADLVHQSVMFYQDRLSGAGFTKVLIAGAGRLPATFDQAQKDLRDRLGVGVEAITLGAAVTVADRSAASADVVEVLGPLAGIALRSVEGEAA